MDLIELRRNKGSEMIKYSFFMFKNYNFVQSMHFQHCRRFGNDEIDL